MKVAFLHYHLKPGGVTTVIRQQIEALQGVAEILVLTGGTDRSSFPAPTVFLEDLSYDTEGGARCPPAHTAEAMLDIMVREFKDLPDLVHVHNPTIAKNRHFLEIIRLLQARGIPLLLQIHDFAEDGRPQSYYREKPYPADCHYAVINLRDRNLLLKSGLKSEGLHFLPNPVSPISVPASVQPENRVLYPVRAIRRKNIGEALLLSLFFHDDASLAITLPPNSPADWAPYQFWKTLADATGLDVRFEAGVGENFPDLMAGSRYVLSTSVSEGFGFSFLEPWTAGKAVWGRYLPDILEDFESSGIRLDHLYPEIRVPLDWMDRQQLSQRFMGCLEYVCACYGVPLEPLNPERFVDTILSGGWIDFGLMDEPCQAMILNRVIRDKPSRRRLAADNPGIDRFNPEGGCLTRISTNREAIFNHYSIAGYRSRLQEVYRRVTTADVRHRIDKTRLILSFLIPETFSLLKWKSYDR